MKKIDLSIIVVSFNTKVLLEKCLNSIFASLRSAPVACEVIVVDNNSTDGTLDMLGRKFGEVTLIKNSTNAGFGRANNQAARLARGATILFLNSDIEVVSDALAKLYSFFKTLNNPAIVGAKLFNTDRSPQSSAGPAYTLTNIFIALFLKGDYVGITRYSPNKIKQVDWVMGACLIMAKSTFTDLGGFDQGIFMYMEEIDLEYRAKKKGIDIYFYPDAHFIHAGAASSVGLESPILNVFRGFIYFYKKHYSYSKNIILRILLVLKSVAAIVLFSLLGNKNDRNAYIKVLKLVIS